MKSLSSICQLALCALLALSSQAEGKGLSDLEAFARSPQNIAKVFSDTATKQKYRRALETYTGKAVPLRDFEATWRKLRRLYTELDGVKDRLGPARQPLSFDYKPGGDRYHFVRVNHPLHAVWLLQNLNEPNTESCTERDNLLADRWTPMLKDATLFAIEKNGVYTGVTLMLVPVQSGAISYLLVVPSDSGAKLPEHLLEAFLRDYRKNQPTIPRFALLTKDPKSKLAYRIERIDDQGRRASRLGAVAGFHLSDPMAKKMLTFAPADCRGAGGMAAGGKPGIDPIGSALGEGGGAGDTNISFNANAQANANPVVNGGASGGAAGLGGLRTQSGGGGSANPGVSSGRGWGRRGESSAPSGVTNNVVTNNDNRVLTPKYRKPSSPEFATSGRGKAGQQQQQQQQWQPQIQNFSPQVARESARESGGRDRGGVPMPMMSGRGSGGGGVGLSPRDQKIARALDEAEKALKEGRPISRDAMRGTFEGTRADNPDLRTRAAKISPAAYYSSRNMEQALEELAAVLDEDPDRDRSPLLENISSNLCKHCPDCEGCEDIANELAPREGAITR